METLLNVLHVLTAVFVIGPMAVLPMTAMRSLRAGHGDQVSSLARSTVVFSIGSVVVALLGFALLGMTGDEHDTSVSTPWVLWSVIAYLVALGLTLFVVVPAMRSAAAGARSGGRPSASYGRIAAPSGIASLLLAVVVVLMVWKP
jgi:uncharacterized membrane protein